MNTNTAQFSKNQIQLQIINKNKQIKEKYELTTI